MGDYLKSLLIVDIFSAVEGYAPNTLYLLFPYIETNVLSEQEDPIDFVRSAIQFRNTRFVHI